MTTRLDASSCPAGVAETIGTFRALFVQHSGKRKTFDEVGGAQRDSWRSGGNQLALGDELVTRLFGGRDRRQPRHRSTAISDLDSRASLHFCDPHARVLTEFANPDFLHTDQRHSQSAITSASAFGHHVMTEKPLLV